MKKTSKIVTVQLLVSSTGTETIQASLEGALERLKKDPENRNFVCDFRGDYKFDGQVEIEAYPCNSDAGTLGRLEKTDLDSEDLHKDAEAEAA
ncbi:MAG: hypothetical protein ING75_17380 [Rhodocyclaceae bacterium]|nr:hypothetical protein [Rhodocyclaceae bacterium]